MIQIEDLTVMYGQHRALSHINLSITSGEIVLIAGPSGCGKSTLIRCLNGLIPHSSPALMRGRVWVGGKDTIHTSVADLARTVGMVFQNPATQFFNLTVDEEIAFGPRNLGLTEKEVSSRVAEALDATGLCPLRDRHISTLSGGEQQRLAIATALAMRPEILVLDEPTSSLDVDGTRQVLQTLRRLNELGTTIVITEHRLDPIAELTHRIVIVEQGRIVMDSPPADCLKRRDLLRRAGLSHPKAEVRRSRDEDSLREEPQGLRRVLVEMCGVEVGFGETPVLRDLNMRLYEGDFAALVGDNGTGKSTLTRVLAGLIKPRHGTIRIGNNGKFVPGKDIGLLFQNPLQQLFCDTVEEDIEFGPRNFGCCDPQKIDTLLDVTDLTSMRRRYVLNLSAGQQQRTALAAVLALEPKLLILDEPTIGQDWGHMSSFMDYLFEINRLGSTILLVTHDRLLIHHYARRILTLCNGRIISEERPTRYVQEHHAFAQRGA